MNHRLDSAFWALRIGLGATAFLAGLDKFFNLLTNWEQYVSPLLTSIVPISPATLMHIAGVIEMIAGIAILAGFARLGGYVVAVWLAAIAVSLLTTGRFFDVAVRDVIMAIGAYTLARLAEVRAEGTAPANARVALNAQRA
ncbi:MAG: DoxX family membrane protein [Thermoanaerobaculia bacterium]